MRCPHCGKDIKEVGPVNYQGDLKAINPVHKLVLTYKVAKGLELHDKGWDRVNFARSARSAKNLLAAFDDDVKAAREWLHEFAQEYDTNNLSWTLETAARHAWDTKGQRIQQQPMKDEMEDGLHGTANC